METAQKKQKVMIVSNNYTPYSGGVVSAIQLLCDRLINEGHEIQLITLDFDAHLQDPPHVTRIPSYYTFDYRMNRMAIPRTPKKSLRHRIHSFKPDIIHVHHPFLLGFWAVSIAKKLNIPTVFTYHTRYEDYSHYVPLLPAKMARWIIKDRVNIFCSMVHSIIVPTQSLKDELQKSGISTLIEVIPTALPMTFFSSNKEKTLNERINLLTVSRFTPEKNIYFLLELFKTLDPKKYFFTLVGYGPLEELLRTYAHQVCGISQENIRFIIKPEKKELHQIYQSSDLFLFASKTETQGLVLAEALAYALPLVALKAPGANDAIMHGFNGYLAEDSDQMKKYIEDIVSDKEKYLAFSANALSKAQAYLPDHWIQKIIKLYHRLINNEPRQLQEQSLFERVE